jgi:hypothetical protein
MPYGKLAGAVLCLYMKESRDLFPCALVVGHDSLSVCIVSLPDSFDDAATNICANTRKRLLSSRSSTFSWRQSSCLIEGPGVNHKEHQYKLNAESPL